LATSTGSPSATGPLNPSDPRLTGPTGRSETTPAHFVVLLAGTAIAVLVRWLLLPTPGLPDDLGQFVLWVHGIATAGLARAYDQNVSFPPVMVYIWSVVAASDTAFRTVTDSADPTIRILMKLPATLADFGLAAGVALALRSQPRWAIAGFLGILLHPAVIYISAWWGQYESIYVLGALVAWLLAVRNRPGLAAVALAVAVMTKPQAVPLLIPFAAWYLARYGLARSARYTLIGAVTIVLLWVPFLAAGGPIAYLRNVGQYQNEIFNVLSVRAWNPWWLFQTAYGGGDFIADSAAIAGPITLRIVGFIVTAILEALVFVAVYRHPTPRSLALGLAAASLVAFSALTTMHERYAFPALVFLALWLPERRVRWTWIVFGVAFTLNLLAAIPPTDLVRRLLPVDGPVGILGSVVLTLVTAVTLALVVRPPRRDEVSPERGRSGQGARDDWVPHGAASSG
jgi:Gpi18-like mannosyltransferase